MARGRKKQETLTLEEQLAAVEKEITEYEGKLKALKEKKKALNNQIEEAQKEKIYRAVVASGRSIDEILAALSDEKKEQE
ncbi:MAG: flagellar export protein FliJ [Blautia sp.]|nr:flagellar export protein FliJ [Oliverpabstia sp.]MDY4000450.1 flagellar export protein FliJ [Blautia sp.]